MCQPLPCLVHHSHAKRFLSLAAPTLFSAFFAFNLIAILSSPLDSPSASRPLPTLPCCAPGHELAGAGGGAGGAEAAGGGGGGAGARRQQALLLAGGAGGPGGGEQGGCSSRGQGDGAGGGEEEAAGGVGSGEGSCRDGSELEQEMVCPFRLHASVLCLCLAPCFPSPNPARAPITCLPLLVSMHSPLPPAFTRELNKNYVVNQPSPIPSRSPQDADKEMKAGVAAAGAAGVAAPTAAAATTKSGKGSAGAQGGDGKEVNGVKGVNGEKEGEEGKDGGEDGGGEREGGGDVAQGKEGEGKEGGEKGGGEKEGEEKGSEEKGGAEVPLEDLSLEERAMKFRVRSAMVWCGVVWCGLVWCGLAIPSLPERRAIFEEFVRTRATAERKEKRSAHKAAVEALKVMLDEMEESGVSSGFNRGYGGLLSRLKTHKEAVEVFKFLLDEMEESGMSLKWRIRGPLIGGPDPRGKWGSDPRLLAAALEDKDRLALLNERVPPPPPPTPPPQDLTHDSTVETLQGDGKWGSDPRLLAAALEDKDRIALLNERYDPPRPPSLPPPLPVPPSFSLSPVCPFCLPLPTNDVMLPYLESSVLVWSSGLAFSLSRQ
ncbi:unnamed protein product [Closterium sp. NIES-53]